MVYLMVTWFYIGGDLMKLYEVQTYLGSHRKTFQHERNALSYKMQLIKTFDFDPEYIEIYPYEANQEEYVYTNIED